MSFRLRIFLLVLVVAGTAIGATAWLTLSLTSRAVTNAEEARDRHQAEIVDEIRRYGIVHGQWTGIDQVVGRLAAGTGLHIRVETRDTEVLVDSDTLENRTSGPVQRLPANVEPVPVLTDDIVRAADRIGSVTLSKREMAALGPQAYRIPPLPRLPANLLGPEPAGSTPEVRALFQVARYRAALEAAHCMAESTGTIGVIDSDQPPYLSEQRLTASPSCAAAGSTRIGGNREWLNEAWSLLAGCRLAASNYDQCLIEGFAGAAASSSVVPVRVFFGVRQGTELDGLQRPGVFGAVALLLAAAAGTAWIARRVSRPVRLLTGASLQLAAGRLDVRVPARGQDELARLSGAFNAMAEALQRSEERQRRLVADVAHELRTPLSNLRGYLEGLADGVVEPSPELFASLHEETLLQRRILDDLQMLALAEAGALGYDPVPVDLPELVEAAVTAHRAVAQNAGVELVADVPGPLEVFVDPDRTRQVLSNLLTNAIRYTDAGGRVEMRVTRDGPEAVLTVRDTGVGMSADEVSRVFDRFWRADPARQRATGGSGLGLTIVRRIVADQGGEVTASSEPGLGTTFTVRLPAVTGISVDPPPSP
ncbi:HAMP domain-containing protein [Actinoplanes hulinensis]|uniref:histidine kinase n=1 Tax=Actinoplanes hulinensis TaxID=1144547 RepID=A0ABS7B2W8_9ACTN|nr:ATP-binding protein [Actinoplanes hulinensis]MBW6435330.1 HAMP domain-containing protein [Actinoplanes hulinensis]